MLLITRPPFVAAILRETEQGVQHHEGYHQLWAEQPQLKSPDLVLPAFSIRIIPLPDRRRSQMLIAQCVAGLLVVPWSKSDDPYENNPWNHRPGLCQPDLAFRLHFVCTNKQRHFRTESASSSTFNHYWQSGDETEEARMDTSPETCQGMNIYYVEYVSQR